MKQVSVKAWGNSLGIRIPKDILDQLRINDSDVLELDVEGDAIVLRKAFRHKTFQERLDAFNGEMSIADFEWGEPQGKELL